MIPFNTLHGNRTNDFAISKPSQSTMRKQRIAYLTQLFMREKAKRFLCTNKENSFLLYSNKVQLTSSLNCSCDLHPTFSNLGPTAIVVMSFVP